MRQIVCRAGRKFAFRGARQTRLQSYLRRWLLKRIVSTLFNTSLLTSLHVTVSLTMFDLVSLLQSLRKKKLRLNHGSSLERSGDSNVTSFKECTYVW